jgi:plastocyanin
MKTRLVAPLALALGAALGLAACGGGSSTPSTVPADADVVVRAKDGIVWDSKEYTATAEGGKVTIYAVNESGIAHNMYVLDEADKVVGSHVDLPKRGSDGTLVYELAPGQYHIVCKVPGHANMKATLTVS